MKWLLWTNIPPEPHAGSKTVPWSGSMTLTMVWTSEERGEELAVVLRALHGELHQEILVDAPENVPAGGAQGLAVEIAEDGFEQVVVEAVVVLRKLVEQRRELALDGVHGIHQGRAEGGARRPVQDGVVTGLPRQHQGAALEEVGVDERSFRHRPGGLIGFDLADSGVITVGGVAQEDDPQHGHTVFAGGQLGIGPELVGGFPEAGFELVNALEGAFGRHGRGCKG